MVPCDGLDLRIRILSRCRHLQCPVAPSPCRWRCRRQQAVPAPANVACVRAGACLGSWSSLAMPNMPMVPGRAGCVRVPCLQPARRKQPTLGLSRTHTSGSSYGCSSLTAAVKAGSSALRVCWHRAAGGRAHQPRSAVAVPGMLPPSGSAQGSLSCATRQARPTLITQSSSGSSCTSPCQL